MKKYLLFVVVFIWASPLLAQIPTGEKILNKVDQNLVVDQGISLTTMIIHGRTGSRTITSKSWYKGQEKAFVEYLSPAREKGKKMLKLDDKIWTYTPEPTDRIIAISGHLLRQSVMGSDLSYEDMTENDKLLELYDAVVEGEEELDGRQCVLYCILRLNRKASPIISAKRGLMPSAGFH